MGLWRPLCRFERDPTARRWRWIRAYQPDDTKDNAREEPGVLGRSGEDQAVISESNGSSLSVTLAWARMNSVTLFSTTMASTSAMRERSDRYQR